MKTPRLQTPHDPMPNMTAMVDLIMCILIFFMLGSKFVSFETFLPSKMPIDVGLSHGGPAAAEAAAVPLVLDLRPGAFGVVVDIQGVARIPAPAEVARDEQHELDLTDRYLEKVTAELTRRQQTMAERTRVVLRPSADLEYRWVVRVFGACLDAGFRDVAFAFAV